MPIPGFDVPNNYYEPDNEEPEMSKTIELNIPASADVRARRSVIINLLEEMLSHDLTKEQTVLAIDDLVGAAIMQATGRTRAGNDVSGI